ncbi:porin [Ancylobacter sp. WKF20]|uniref:porin n=1 Tax=Ancylobacter sp. WKF20 TaxID=3039801 RepID=UPI002434473D|nr:porin [Ancylobacter sp. WKF20]WGD29464.1 porin [Ancylobacter sp. WKF20]
MNRVMHLRRRGAHAVTGMGFALLALALAMALVLPARAETPPGVSASPAKTTSAAMPPAASPDPFCAAQGAGFVRLEGTQTCLKLGGYVQIDSTTQNGPAAGLPAARAPALQSR